MDNTDTFDFSKWDRVEQDAQSRDPRDSILHQYNHYCKPHGLVGGKVFYKFMDKERMVQKLLVFGDHFTREGDQSRAAHCKEILKELCK